MCIFGSEFSCDTPLDGAEENFSRDETFSGNLNFENTNHKFKYFRSDTDSDECSSMCAAVIAKWHHKRILRLLLKAKQQQLETELCDKNKELSRMEEELNEKEVERKQLLNDVQELKVLHRSQKKVIASLGCKRHDRTRHSNTARNFKKVDLKDFPRLELFRKWTFAVRTLPTKIVFFYWHLDRSRAPDLPTTIWMDQHFVTPMSVGIVQVMNGTNEAASNHLRFFSYFLGQHSSLLPSKTDTRERVRRCGSHRLLCQTRKINWHQNRNLLLYFLQICPRTHLLCSISSIDHVTSATGDIRGSSCVLYDFVGRTPLWTQLH